MIFLKLTTLPVGGNVAKRQKVIPFLREMSRSDKRIADVLRVPFSPEKGAAFMAAEGAEQVIMLP